MAKLRHPKVISAVCGARPERMALNDASSQETKLPAIIARFPTRLNTRHADTRVRKIAYLKYIHHAHSV